MPLYFMLHDAARFHQELCPLLAEAWRRRSFEACRRLCRDLAPRVLAEQSPLNPEQPLLCHVAQGLAFDRDYWRLLAGELLLFTAVELPAAPAAPETLRFLLAPQRQAEEPVPRERFTPIEQAHLGSRDLTFGGARYRPEQAGYNDVDDVRRLASYLAAQNPEQWRVADLAALDEVPEDERADELEFARHCFAVLAELYARAAQHGHVVVCEWI
jgi:hypothetical protein